MARVHCKNTLIMHIFEKIIYTKLEAVGTSESENCIVIYSVKENFALLMSMKQT